MNTKQANTFRLVNALSVPLSPIIGLAPLFVGMVLFPFSPLAFWGSLAVGMLAVGGLQAALNQYAQKNMRQQ